MEEYKVVYDVLNDSSRIFSFATLLTLLLVGGGLFRTYQGILIRREDKRNDYLILGLLFTTIAGTIGGFCSWNVASEQLQCKAWARNGNFQVVEGKVENFIPMPPHGHSHEKFTVKGVEFDYSDNDLTQGGFNQTQVNGGPIKEGLYVRIAYHKGRILKIEVRCNEGKRGQ